MKLPDKIFGIDVEGKYEKFLGESKKEVKTRTQTPRNIEVHTSLDGINLGDYVFEPHNGIYIAKRRTHLGENWYKSHEGLHKERARMLTIREFIDFLKLLKNGDAKDGLGNRISKSELETLYKDITKKVDPYRAEWLDADFKALNGVLHINYNHRTINAQLRPQNLESLEDCLRENCYVDLFSANKQGMPTKKASGKEDFYYHAPLEDNNSVAKFIADVDGALLYCSRDPDDSVPSFGVRAVRDKIG